jgi:hypothetical protein
MSELDHDPDDLAGTELLARARRAYEPGEARELRMKQKIDASIAAAAIASAAGSTQATGASMAATVKTSLGLLAAVTVVASGLWLAQPQAREARSTEARSTDASAAGATEVASPAVRVEPTLAAVEEPVPLAEAIEGGASARPATPASDVRPTEPAPREPASRAPAPTETASRETAPTEAAPTEAAPASDIAPVIAPPADPLDRELELLDEADRALARGDASGALRTLETHAREHPTGALAAEREVRRVLALCAAGRTDEARQRYALLDRSHVGSTIAARLRASCAAPP